MRFRRYGKGAPGSALVDIVIVLAGALAYMALSHFAGAGPGPLSEWIPGG